MAPRPGYKKKSTLAIEAWIEAHLAAPPTDECLIPPTRVGRDGYPAMLDSTKVGWVILERTVGPRPPGLEMCHSCDYRLCCNRAHLRWDTRASNVADMIARGRGRGHFAAKLTEEQVAEIRATESSVTHAELGRHYGVSASCVGLIRRGQRRTR